MMAFGPVAARQLLGSGLAIAVVPERNRSNGSGQGPCEEFLTDNALGFDAAPSGGLFLKINIGILRRPDAAPYDRYRAYEIVDGGRWSTTVAKRKGHVPLDAS
jgi:hypothetical protein